MIERKSFSNIPKPAQSSTSFAKAVGADSFFVAGKSFTQFRDDAVIIGRLWPAEMGEADFETPL
jgi:hypothetical protein